MSKNCLDIAPIKIYCLFVSVPYTRLKKKMFICAILFFTEYNSGDQMKLEAGHGSSVGIATGYGLDGPGIESRWGARFSAPVQTVPGTHPASCTMGTGSFPAGAGV